MLYIKVVTRINPKSSQCNRKKKKTTPRDRGLPPRDRFTDGGERSVVGKGLKGSRPSPEAGWGPGSQDSGQSPGASGWVQPLETPRRCKKLRTSSVSAGLTLACSPSSQALTVLPWNEGSLWLSHRQVRAGPWAAQTLQGQVHTPPRAPNLLKSLGKGGNVPVGLSNHWFFLFFQSEEEPWGAQSSSKAKHKALTWHYSLNTIMIF